MNILGLLYQKLLKPVLFLFDAELVHNFFNYKGQFLAKYFITRKLVEMLFSYKNTALHKNILGIEFKNPVGMPAGFDYKGEMVGILASVGYGFNTVGTVTAKHYEGNPKPRLKRLPKSKSLLVNKGFKSDGVDVLLPKLNNHVLKDITFGVSVGSSNLPEINTIDKAIEDYIYSFKKLETSPYIKYYELNISCPNTSMTENFTNTDNLEKLFIEMKKLNLTRPIFIKMPNELDITIMDKIVNFSMSYGYKAFVFSNLVKDRSNSSFDKDEIANIAVLKGNFSGKPAAENSKKLIIFFRQKYKKDIIIVACGGIFTPLEAKERFDLGADLIQVLTGMIYTGPQLIGDINRFLAKNLSH